MIADGQASLGVCFFPWILRRFDELYMEFAKTSHPFDLCSILVFDPEECPRLVSEESVRACHGHRDFLLEYEWMTRLGKPCPFRLVLPDQLTLPSG